MPYPIHPKADKIIKITCAQLKGQKEESVEGGSNRFNKTRKNIK